jgi:uncharacterized repeat protein (TIGR03803 family)
MSQTACRNFVLSVCLMLTVQAALDNACAKSIETVLYHFKGGTDGGVPEAALTIDANGNLYGTTAQGGNMGCDEGLGCGTVFTIPKGGKEVVLHAFQGGKDGEFPKGQLIADAKGNFYGTTEGGGADGFGTVFKLAPDGTETLLYAFRGGNDGSAPMGGLTPPGKKLRYGTTYAGGSDCNCGTVFALSADNKETVLHAFQGDQDGAYPSGTLLIDNDGRIFGTTGEGGITNGMIFRLSPKGVKTVLYQFKGGSDGRGPQGLAMDSKGSLYTTTLFDGADGGGTLVKLYSSGTFVVLHSFGTGTDGTEPYSAPVLDNAGNIYGTTWQGGSAVCSCGTAFKTTPKGKETIIHSFRGGHDGSSPMASLIVDASGNLYGTTTGGGGYNAGTVFEITP